MVHRMLAVAIGYEEVCPELLNQEKVQVSKQWAIEHRQKLEIKESVIYDWFGFNLIKALNWVKYMLAIKL